MELMFLVTGTPETGKPDVNMLCRLYINEDNYTFSDYTQEIMRGRIKVHHNRTHFLILTNQRACLESVESLRFLNLSPGSEPPLPPLGL